MNTCEYIEKDPLLKWLYSKMLVQERCVEKALATNSETLAIHQERLETTKSIIDKVIKTKAMTINGSTSDGYHTFDELYHHRAVLFSVIVSLYPELSWKSKLHADGMMYDGMFIVGIDTPSGPATYHYDIDPYWRIFKCRELEKAPKWDGHTPEEAIRRIGTMRGLSPVRNNQNGSGRKTHEAV